MNKDRDNIEEGDNDGDFNQVKLVLVKVAFNKNEAVKMEKEKGQAEEGLFA